MLPGPGDILYIVGIIIGTVMRNDSVIQSQSAKCKVQSDNDIK